MIGSGGVSQSGAQQAAVLKGVADPLLAAPEEGIEFRWLAALARGSRSLIHGLNKSARGAIAWAGSRTGEAKSVAAASVSVQHARR